MVTPQTDVAAWQGFSIGEAAAIVGVSTHVIRSWERRLALDLNHRTQSNQRRYWMEDVQRFITIRRLHESGGLPLNESAAKALSHETAQSAGLKNTGHQPDDLNAYWAKLIDNLPDILLVVDEAGRIAAANDTARSRLSIRFGASFTRLAPGGWRRTYRTLLRSAGSQRQPHILAMRGRSGILFMDARLVRVGRTTGGPIAVIGARVREVGSAERAVAQIGGPNDG